MSNGRNKKSFSERTRRFFEGRNGSDALSRALIWGALALLVVSMLTESVLNGVLSNILWAVSLIVMAFGYFRIFSKDIYRRQAENEKYQKFTRKLFGDPATRAGRRAEKKQHKHFSCPACKAKMRVPRNKGKVKITCAKCGVAFYGKT